MARRARARRALEVTRVARRGRLLRVLREIGVTRRERPPTSEAARAFSPRPGGARHDLRETRAAALVAARPAARRVRVGEALADLQRIALSHGIALPTSFALVGKTLSQADSVARALDPKLDPIELLEEDGIAVMLQEAERRLEPDQLLSLAYTQLEPLVRMPRRLTQLVSRVDPGRSASASCRTSSKGSRPSRARSRTASALMARVNETVAVVGFALSVALGLFELWRIFRTPGGL